MSLNNLNYGEQYKGGKIREASGWRNVVDAREERKAAAEAAKAEPAKRGPGRPPKQDTPEAPAEA